MAKRSREKINADVKEALWSAMKAEGADPKQPPKYAVAQAGLRRFIRENPDLVEEAAALYPEVTTPEGSSLPVWLGVWMAENSYLPDDDVSG